MYFIAGKKLNKVYTCIVMINLNDRPNDLILYNEAKELFFKDIGKTNTS